MSTGATVDPMYSWRCTSPSAVVMSLPEVELGSEGFVRKPSLEFGKHSKYKKLSSTVVNLKSLQNDESRESVKSNLSSQGTAGVQVTFARGNRLGSKWSKKKSPCRDVSNWNGQWRSQPKTNCPPSLKNVELTHMGRGENSVTKSLQRQAMSLYKGNSQREGMKFKTAPTESGDTVQSWRFVPLSADVMSRPLHSWRCASVSNCVTVTPEVELGGDVFKSRVAEMSTDSQLVPKLAVIDTHGPPTTDE